MKRILLTLALLALPSLAVAQPSLIGTVAADGKTTATSAANPVPIAGTVTTNDQKGAGATTATTLRTVTATDSPEVTVLSVLSTALGTLGVAIPPLGVLMSGTDGVLLQALRVVDLDLGAGTDYYQGIGLMLRAAGGGAFVSGGNGAADAGTIRVIEAGVSSGASTHVDVTAAEVAVLAAKAGRKYLRIQVYSDTDGAVCCALGATTSACTIGEILDPSPAADKGGGSLDFTGYGGAVTCRATGAWTTTVAATEY